jgi:hypothetical protein
MDPPPVLLRSLLFMDLPLLGRVPDRCMGDFDRLKDGRAYDRAVAKTRRLGGKERLDLVLPNAFLKA